MLGPVRRPVCPQVSEADQLLTLHRYISTDCRVPLAVAKAMLAQAQSIACEYAGAALTALCRQRSIVMLMRTMLMHIA